MGFFQDPYESNPPVLRWWVKPLSTTLARWSPHRQVLTHKVWPPHDLKKTCEKTWTCTVITLWTTSGSPLESSTKWRAFNFLESGNMYLYYISTFYGPQAHPFCRGFWRGYEKTTRFPRGNQHIYIYIPGTHLSFVLPPKEGLFQSKQGTFGFQVYIYI